MSKMSGKKGLIVGISIVLLMFLISGPILAAPSNSNDTFLPSSLSRPLTLNEMDEVSGEFFAAVVYSIFSCAMDPFCRYIAVTGAKIAYEIISGVALIDWVCDGCVRDAIF